MGNSQVRTVSLCMYVLDTPEYSVQRTYFSGVLYIYIEVLRTHTDGRHPRNRLNSTMDSLFIYLCKYSVLLIECSTKYGVRVYYLYILYTRRVTTVCAIVQCFICRLPATLVIPFFFLSIFSLSFRAYFPAFSSSRSIFFFWLFL